MANQVMVHKNGNATIVKNIFVSFIVKKRGNPAQKKR